MSKRKVLTAVTTKYLESPDFNGLPMGELLGPRMWPKKVLTIVRTLVADGLLRTLRSEHCSNPFILQWGCVSVEEQLEALDGERPFAAILYPSEEHLAKTVDRGQYERRPFTLELALGAPQLAHRNFEPMILEQYVSDPRYTFRNDDVCGQIGLRDDATVPDKDDVFLQTFGFSFAAAPPEAGPRGHTRAVAVYLRYLNALTPEHQTMWKTRQVGNEFGLHPDYYRSSIQAEWYERFPIHTALIEEMKVVNEMSDAMGRALFFKDVERPRGLFFLLLPTRKKYLDYCSLLDRLLSENINLEFFKDEVERRFTDTNSGGVIGQAKGSITILKEWIRATKVTMSDDYIDRMLKKFRQVREARQPAAHGLHDDEYDASFFEEQRLRAEDAYLAVRILRMMLAGHPAVRARRIEAPMQLNEGSLWFA